MDTAYVPYFRGSSAISSMLAYKARSSSRHLKIKCSTSHYERPLYITVMMGLT
jgi:hypothetical protein